MAGFTVEHMTVITLRCKHRDGAARECGRVVERYEVAGQFADGDLWLWSHGLGGVCRKHPAPLDPTERLAQAVRHGWRAA